MDKEKEMTCSPNYEALYNEYVGKYKCMCEKFHKLELKLEEEHEQRMILEAKMEVVRLIFGGTD